jgi:hypothetical protein
MILAHSLRNYGIMRTVAYSNAQRQKRWRDKRNALAGVLTGTPREIAAGILRHLGPDRARKVMRALGKRLRGR